MQPKTHHVNGQTFVVSPYRAKTFIRDDVFWRQLTVTCQGHIEYPEGDPAYRTCWAPRTLVLGQHGLIEQAMALAERCVSKHQFGSSLPTWALDFEPELIIVHDAVNRLVLTGHAEHAVIRWCDPVDSEDAGVLQQVEELFQKAAHLNVLWKRQT